MRDERSSRSDDAEQGFDRAPSEVFDGPAHAINLGVNQSASVNDQKKRELESAFGDRYHFELVKHHGTLSPIEGDHEIAWIVRNAEDVEDTGPALPDGDDDDNAIRPSASDDQQLGEHEPEGLKDGLDDGDAPDPVNPDSDSDSEEEDDEGDSRTVAELDAEYGDKDGYPKSGNKADKVAFAKEQG